MIWTSLPPTTRVVDGLAIVVRIGRLGEGSIGVEKNIPLQSDCTTLGIVDTANPYDCIMTSTPNTPQSHGQDVASGPFGIVRTLHFCRPLHQWGPERAICQPRFLCCVLLCSVPSLLRCQGLSVLSPGRGPCRSTPLTLSFCSCSCLPGPPRAPLLLCWLARSPLHSAGRHAPALSSLFAPVAARRNPRF